MRTLESFRDIHTDDPIIVCGCGRSVLELAHPKQFITIGVNDIGRLFAPTYLVVLNPPDQFCDGRFQWVESSNARFLFTQLDLPVRHQNIVRFTLGTFGGTDFSNPSVLHYTQNSPYVGMCLAALMGARTIGLIGVDFTDHHFFASTGTHPLTASVSQIDSQYRSLFAALKSKGVSVVNLSTQSRLTSLPKCTIDEFVSLSKRTDTNPTPPQPTRSMRRIFFVHYRFLACGDVFAKGLTHAAEREGCSYEGAYWDDPALRTKIDAFNPDLLFVVHGRNFARTWGTTFSPYRSAVWLLDEPYEVDDTTTFSRNFDTVFVNDPRTLSRHHNAHYLPVCYDPLQHRSAPSDIRPETVGFIGGHNEHRETFLLALAAAGHLSYCAGGPWRSAVLQKMSRGATISPEECARLYRTSRIVVNIFRTQHHFNGQGIKPVSANPRIYEALACGSLVVSEYREELATLFPELPTFSSSQELLTLIDGLLKDNGRFDAVRAACAQRLKGNTYHDRLRHVLHQVFTDNKTERAAPATDLARDTATPRAVSRAPTPLPSQWRRFGIEPSVSGTAITMQKKYSSAPGTERGIVTTHPYDGIDLSFELYLEPGVHFIAKVHQEQAENQCTNSYHLRCADNGDYLARHDHILYKTALLRSTWIAVSLVRERESLSLYLDHKRVFNCRDSVLRKGYAFLGVKGGQARIRDIVIKEPSTHAPLSQKTDGATIRQTPAADHEILIKSDSASAPPMVSIITTVYDRVECLKQCLRSVQNQSFKDFEHIVVADCPPLPIIRQITEAVREENDPRISFISMKRRHNNWGITPAETGLVRSYGTFVAFLSDDNGYTADHLHNLTHVLLEHPDIGFAYSSCLYDGRKVLDAPTPSAAKIDLGQPLLRRATLEQILGLRLPFNEFAWDWKLIEHLIKSGVRWRHINKATFIFRLANYPLLAPPPLPISSAAPSRSKTAENNAASKLPLQTYRPLVTISIACHNNMSATEKCIESVLRTAPAASEIIITDNASTDATPAFLASLSDGRCVVHQNSTNRGYGAAHNHALSIAKGEWFIVLNNDCIVPENWIDPLIEALNVPNVRIAGPFVCRLDANGKGCAWLKPDYDYIEGSCLATGTAFARAIGLFDPWFEFMYCEDADFSLRARARGFDIRRVSIAVHHERASSVKKTRSIDIHGYWVKNHYRLSKRWRSYLDRRTFEQDLYIRRTGAIGDVFLLSPIIEQLYRENVHRKIHLITSCPQLLEGNPHISSVCSAPPENTHFIDLDLSYERNPTMHVIDSYAAQFDIGPLESRRPVYFLDQPAIERARAEFGSGYITVHPGPSPWPGRQLPITTFRMVIDELRRRGYVVVECGHHSLLENADLDATGRSWRETAAIIHNAAGFFGIDSAPMHLAQAFGIPGVAAFGCIDPNYRLTDPDRLRPVTAAIACSGCHHWRIAPRTFSDCLRKTPECMNRITSESIVEELTKMVKITTVAVSAQNNVKHMDHIYTNDY
jgi:GT2 family glycosyltransferase/ADP-heptose:LPS heptosyltransferase